ncbi:MAG: MauE/DoxX family redox-associated membrane protein [Gammaproteobacteria bacterium]|nr:MauE/DoxX family redox-associated membrane protein [Gammaproteobacteria bacterium]
MIDPLLVLIISASLALLFFMAARHKMSEPLRFAGTLAAYRILPEAMVPRTARILPYLEMAVVFMILVPPTRPLAALAAAVLLAVYALAMGLNLARGRSDIDCGCGGQPQLLSPWLICRNLVLVAGCGLLLLPVADRRIALADALLLALMTAVLAMLYLMVEQLVRNHSLSLSRSSPNG